jgi:PAS domain S-box-containing protein
MNKFYDIDKSSNDLMKSLISQFDVNSYEERINEFSLEVDPIQNRKKPMPIDKEINLDPNKTIMSKTDAKGVIEYANEYFIEISGYDEYELMGQPHNIVRHPDMPKTIFKLMWESLNKGENIHAFVKNLSKDGRYYWVLTNFEFKYDESGNLVSYYAKRKAAPRNAIFEIEKLYNTLRNIEARQGMNTAVNYVHGLLEDKKMSFNEYIFSLLNVDGETLKHYFNNTKPEAQINSPEEKKKGLFGRMFS